jgi:lactate dehydrogenase-like 2-hydroxyacid dehydrogenase
MVTATFEAFSQPDLEFLLAAEAKTDLDVVIRGEPVGDEDVILVEHRDIDGEWLRRMPALRCVVAVESGRALLPYSQIRARGVEVRIVPNLSGLGVAEHAFALLLALKKQVTRGDAAVRQNRWRPEVVEPLFTDQRAHTFNWAGLDNLGWLWRETLGIVGFGRIGQAIAKRARAFDMEMCYFDRHPVAAAVERHLGVQYLPLDDLLTRSDAVTLHLPFSVESEHLIGQRELSLMKPTALLINTARGRVVDEKALISALQSRKIAGAGLDVFVYEPIQPDNPLIGLDNVILTPHVAGVFSPVARQRQILALLQEALNCGGPEPEGDRSR